MGLHYFLTGCEKEDEIYKEDAKLIEPSKVNISVLRTEDVEKNTNLMRVINKAEKKVSKNKANKTVYNADYDFTINTSYAKVIENNGLKNYTFGVYRTEDNGLLENLLLEEQADSTFKVSLVQYNITNTEKDNLINKQIVDVEDKITLVELDDISDSIFNKEDASSETCTVFSYDWEQGSSCASGQHDYTDGGECDFWGNANQMATSGGWVLTSGEIDCGSGGGSTQGTSGPTGNSSGGNLNGGSGGTYVPPTTSPVLCPECLELEEDDIVSYNLLNNDCAKNIIKNEIMGTSNSQGTNGLLINQLRDLFGYDEDVDLVFRNLDNVPDNADAVTSFDTDVNIASGTYKITITLSDSYLDNNPTKLHIAMVLIHEMVHAKLMYDYLHGNLLTNYPNYTALNTAMETFLANRNIDNGEALNDAMHIAMVDLLGTMAYSLFKYSQHVGMDNITNQYCKDLTNGSFYNTPAMPLIDTGNNTAEGLNTINVNEQDNTTNAQGDDC